MCLMYGEYFNEFLEMGDTSASKKVYQPFNAVTSMSHFENVFSLRPRDASDVGVCELSDKGVISFDEVQQWYPIGSQHALPPCIQRAIVAVLSSDICNSNWEFVLTIITI